MLRDDTHTTAGAPPCCLRCRAPIGAYEPLVYEGPDGERVTSALLRLPRDLREHPSGVAFFHLACATAA
ncbi:hypothetical protein [Baekduia sp. Peel2402]|uniref:hypothetical protein n=1 Tax=Baekduia sp. Peel2402 TaxID=3458296 RepID=UPI00403E9AC6